MWLAATVVNSTALQTVHIIQIRMKLTKRSAFFVLGRIVLVTEQGVTPLDNIMRLDLLFLVLQVTK